MKYTGPRLGVATWVVNTIGCLLIGILAGWVMTATWSAGSKNIVHLLLITGLCGGFTTFSSFTLDCVKYFESGQVAAGLIYVMMTLFVGLSCCALGYWIGAKF